jgi:putative methionine-R-sulfoxide reductase with GAF domain
VLPVFSEGRIIGVLDIDSAVEDDFTSLDVTSLQELVKIAERYL